MFAGEVLYTTERILSNERWSYGSVRQLKTRHILVTNRKLLHEASEDEAIWTVVGEEENERVKLTDVLPKA